MDVLKDAPGQEVINEIQYFIALSVLKNCGNKAAFPCRSARKRMLLLPKSTGF